MSHGSLVLCAGSELGWHQQWRILALAQQNLDLCHLLQVNELQNLTSAEVIVPRDQTPDENEEVVVNHWAFLCQSGKVWPWLSQHSQFKESGQTQRSPSCSEWFLCTQDALKGFLAAFELKIGSI